jgi:DNA-binding XRE family transcriptional regulator
MSDSDLAREMRETRRLLGLTQGELGEAIGYAKNSVWRIEAGLRTPNRPRLIERALRDLRREHGYEG